MKRLGMMAALCAVVAACDDPATQGVSQLNLDRPVDVAFACYGGLRVVGGDGAQPSDEVVITAQPTSACETRSNGGVPAGQEDLTGQGGKAIPGHNWYGLILQSGGTVALAQFPVKAASSFEKGDVTVVDADPLQPGKNAVSVGIHPVAIATDTSGCYAVTANEGSCDVSTVNVTSLLAHNTEPVVTRHAVLNADGQPIVARPAALVAAPPADAIGATCSAMPQGLAYIAYPACHAVAVVDLASMKAVASVRFAPTGEATIGDGSLVCPTECGVQTPAAAGPRPVTLALRETPDHTRLAIGADNSNRLTLLELDAAGLPSAATQVALVGQVGVSQLALSPTIPVGGDRGVVHETAGPGGKAQFVYAVASDGTVRVAEVLGTPRECDTQIDPRSLQAENDIARLACLPVGEVALPRRPGARSPGIVLPGDATPTSVAFVSASPDLDSNAFYSPTRLVGHYAVVTASNGASHVVNVDDDLLPDTYDAGAPLTTQLPLVTAHQLRDALPARDALAEKVLASGQTRPLCGTFGPNPNDATGNRAGPRVTAAPVQVGNSAVMALAQSLALPSLRQSLCEGDDETKAVSSLSFAAPLLDRVRSFPDLRALRSDEQWNLVWEGALSGDTATTSINGPVVRTGVVATAGDAMTLTDEAKPFCHAGVEPFDIVAFRGCDPGARPSQCHAGFECYVHPESPVNVGICVPRGAAQDLAAPCKDFFTSSRRYAVTSSKAGQLTLMPRTKVLRSTPLSGCTSDTQCSELAIHEAKLLSGGHPMQQATPTLTTRWACQADSSRAGTAPRCVQQCTVAKDCGGGASCLAGRCVEGVVPPAMCVGAPQRFELQASEAFTVIGTKTGYVHPVIADAQGVCVTNPSAHRLERGRLPLQAPPCTNDGVGPNPCMETVTQVERVPRYVPGACAPAVPDSELVSRTTTGVRFRNAGLDFTLVDPTYPGDMMCRGDRAGGLVDVPLVFPGYTIRFTLTAGFTPLALEVPASFPARVINGPTNSFWIVDEGDYSTDSIATKGRVFRVESEAISVVNVMQ